MTRARARARTGGQPPLIPSWSVTPEALPPGYVYTGGLRTQMLQGGSIGWAPHNAIWRSQFQAVPGNPGSLGDGWGALGTVNGITRECVSVGVIDGHTYVDVRYFGTSTAASAHAIQPNASVAFGTGAVAGDTVSASVFVQLLAGALPVSPQLNLQITERAANAAFVANSVTSITALSLTAGGPAVLVSHTRTLTGATTVYFDPAVRLDAGVGFTMDFTIRVWAFQANRGPLLPCIPSNGGGAYLPRTADYSDSMEPVLGPELVANGGFDSAATWSLSGGSSISGGVAVATGLGQYGIISQAANTTAGRLYRVTFDVVSISAGAVRAIFHGNTQQSLANVTAVGRFSVDVVATGSNTSIALQSAIATSLSGQFDNFSVREITGYVGARRGIKLEPQATNLLRNSQCVGAVVGSPGSAPTNWLYAGRGAPVSTVGVGFEGGAAYVDVRIQGTLTDLNPFIDFDVTAAANGAPAVSQATYVGSVYVRRLAGDIRPLWPTLRFGTDAGTYTNDSVGAVGSISDIGSLFVVTGAPGASATRGVLRLTINAAAGSAIDMTMRISRPQLELGAVATSYIPTYGSQVTRAAEGLEWPTASVSGYRTSGGTFAVDISTPSAFTTYRQILSVDNGINTSDRFPSISINTDGNARLDIFQGGAQLVGVLLRPFSRGKVAASWESGVSVALATDSSTPLRVAWGNSVTSNAVSKLVVGNRSGQPAPISMSFYRLDYYPRAATDAQLRALTA